MTRRNACWLAALALLHTAVTIGAEPAPAPARPRTAPWLVLSEYASGLARPGALLALPNGDLLVAEPGAAAGKGRILALRDADRDGTAEQRLVLRSDLDRPDGLLLRRDRLLVAHAAGVDACAFLVGQLRPVTACRSLDLPGVAGAVRGLTMSPDEQSLYVLVDGRVVTFPPVGGASRDVDAAGAAQATGLAVEPRRAGAWRAALGPVGGPGYVLAPVGKPSPEAVETARVTLQFYRRRALPPELLGGALLALPPQVSGDAITPGRILAVPFRDGAPAGPAQELAVARDASFDPSGLAVMGDGSIVVADAAQGRIWRLSYLP